MITVTSVEIIEYRAELAGDPDALSALDTLEDCEGDVEDAAIALAIHVGQEPNCSEQWLDSLAKRWRSVICESSLQQTLSEAESIAEIVRSLKQHTNLPALLQVPVAIYLLKTGIPTFCEPLNEKL